MFLTAADVNIARQLAGVYGNDVTAALGSSQAAALRMVQTLADINRTGQDITRGVLTDFTQQIPLHALERLLERSVDFALNQIKSPLLTFHRKDRSRRHTSRR